MRSKLLVSSLIFLPFVFQLAYSTPSAPSDYWGHLITGRELVMNGFVRLDTLNVFPVKVTFHDYLGKIILYLTYKFRKPFKALILYIILIEILALTDGNVLATVIPYFLIAIYFYSPILRPMTLGFPLFLLLLIFLYKHKLSLTIPLIILWSQIHATWIYGLLAIFLHILTYRCIDIQMYRRLKIHQFRCIDVWKYGFLYIYTPVLLAVLTHPYHLGLFRVFGAIGKLSFIKEWNTPEPLSLIGILFWVQIFLVFFMLYFSETRPPFFDFALFVIFSAFTIIAVRNVPFHAVVTARILSLYLPSKNLKLKNALIACLIFSLIFPLFIKENPTEYRVIDQVIPLFNSQDQFISLPGWSDYIEFKTGAKALIDTRLLSPEAKKIFEDFILNKDGEILKKFRINKVLLPESFTTHLGPIQKRAKVVKRGYALINFKWR